MINNKILTIILVSLLAIAIYNKTDVTVIINETHTTEYNVDSYYNGSTSVNPDLIITNKPNVSYDMAIEIINKELSSHSGDSKIALNTLTVSKLNTVFIRGEKWYSGLCDFKDQNFNMEYNKNPLNKKPCIAIINSKNKKNKIFFELP